MKTTVKRYTKDDLRALAESGQAIVMEEDHKKVFEPWPMSKVEQCSNDIYNLTIKHNGVKSQISAEVEKNETLKDFIEHHPMLYDKLSNIDFCKDPRTMKTLLQMFKIKRQQEMGEMNQEQAQSAATMAALKIGLPENHPAQPSIVPED